MKENEMIHTGRVLIVEGKYDAARLSHLTDAMILLTDGFGIYSDKKRQQLFKALAQKNGLILLTDSDAAGFRIRTYITNLVGEKNVVQAYVPAIHGKEKRKEQPGKEGLLGVEGVDDAIVLQALRDALGAEAGAAAARPEGRQITYTDLYEWGLSGRPGSAERKAKLLNALGLPPRLSKKELVEALNRLYTFEQLDVQRSVSRSAACLLQSLHPVHCLSGWQQSCRIHCRRKLQTEQSSFQRNRRFPKTY